MNAFDLATICEAKEYWGWDPSVLLESAALIPSLQRAVWSVNAGVPIVRILPMDGFVAASAGNRRFTLLAIQALAFTALLLAALGLYGVVSGSITERVREIGI